MGSCPQVSQRFIAYRGVPILSPKDLLYHFTYTFKKFWKHCGKWNKSDIKEQIVWFHLYEGPRVVEFIETESRMVVTRSWVEGENGKLLLSGQSFCFVLFFSVTKLCLALCDPMDCSMSGFPVLHHPPELAQTHVHRVSDAIQPSHPLSLPFPPALNPSHHQGLFQRVSSLDQVAKVLELQFRHQSFQWIFRVDFL